VKFESDNTEQVQNALTFYTSEIYTQMREQRQEFALKMEDQKKELKGELRKTNDSLISLTIQMKSNQVSLVEKMKEQQTMLTYLIGMKSQEVNKVHSKQTTESTPTNGLLLNESLGNT
jgi:hypothetical protein